MLGPPATQRFRPRLALRLLEIYAMLNLCYTCDFRGIRMAVEKFAQEVGKIATLKGYKIRLKRAMLILFTENIFGEYTLKNGVEKFVAVTL